MKKKKEKAEEIIKMNYNKRTREKNKILGVQRSILLSPVREEEAVKEGVQKVPFHWHSLVVSLHVSYLPNLSQAIAMASICILACLEQFWMFPCHLALQADE